MNPEVQSLILQQFSELKEEVRASTKDLGNKVDVIAARVADIDARVIHLEKEVHRTRWVWAGAGGIIAIAVKEFLTFTIKNSLPALNEAAASVFLALL